MKNPISKINLALLTFLTPLCFGVQPVVAQNTSSPAFLQMFEASWETIDERMPDIFAAGYSRLWVPPPARADSGGLSVGYDVFDRFDLGSPRNRTLYGTELGLKTMINGAHRAGIRVNTDFIPNHNGFSDSSTFDDQGTPLILTDDVTWEESGGYPGFLTTLSAADDPNGVGAIDGDFHSVFATGEEFFRLAGLIDIDHTTNHQFIRNPVTVGDPLNIPAGTSGIFGRPPANVPDPNNARFYPDQGLGGTSVFDARIGQNVTLYDYNTANPLAGDAVTDNALGLMMRNARWMIQEIGVDGFRIDAARHFPRWVLNYFDQAMFLAKKETLLDGSPDHAFSFIETGGDNRTDWLQEFIRKDINPADLTQVGGNRDALDFNLFFSLRGNLTDNGLVNDWRNVKNWSIDNEDDGFANNGSQGVAFVQSHDDVAAHLNDVAHAYALMRPGNALVYFNADQFDHPLRLFPKPGRSDALGGMFGDRVTKLVNLRNTHGRGDYLDRTPAADEKELLIYEREKSAVVLLNNRMDAGHDQRIIQTSFVPGTVLIELTGNAADPLIDPNNDFAEVVTVAGNGTISVSVPRNLNANGIEHGAGYLIYGVSGPQGEMRLTNAAGADLTNVIAGHTPTPGEGGAMGPSDDQLNGTTRLSDITIINDATFKIRVETDKVTHAGGFRDQAADGDYAEFRIDDGIDANGNGSVDTVTPGDLSYGFEEFLDTFTPGFFEVSGEGVYEQSIDVTQLSEGRHYLTGRAYRMRNPANSGDGGPPVFTEWRETIYVDRFDPESEIVSFDPFESDPGNPDDRDLIARSTDGTADNMHIFLDLPAGLSDAQVLAMALGGQQNAGEYDRDSWIFGFEDVTTGNHVATVVTFEPTGRSSVRRTVGLFTDTNQGAGFGDLDADGTYEASDLSGVGGFEEILYSQNSQFAAAADVTADGLVDTRDLLALGAELLTEGAPALVLSEYEAALDRRADINDDGQTNADDLAALYALFGSSDFLADVNTDGSVDAADVAALITDLIRTVPGDFNLDGTVDAADFTVWRDQEGSVSPALAADGDFDGDVDTGDYTVWRSAFGFVRAPFGATSSSSGTLGVGASPSSSAATPEPSTLVLVWLAAGTALLAKRRDV